MLLLIMEIGKQLRASKGLHQSLAFLVKAKIFHFIISIGKNESSPFELHTSWCNDVPLEFCKQPLNAVFVCNQL